MGRYQKIILTGSILTLMLVMYACRASKPAGAYLFLSSDSITVQQDTLLRSIDEDLAVNLVPVDSGYMPAFHLTEKSVSISEGDEQTELMDIGYPVSAENLAFKQERNLIDQEAIADQSSTVSEKDQPMITDSLMAYLRQIKISYEALDNRMAGLERTFTNNVTKDTIIIVNQFPAEIRLISAPGPEEGKTDEAAVRKRASEERPENVPDIIPVKETVKTDTVFIPREVAQSALGNEAIFTDSLASQVLSQLRSNTESIESLRETIDRQNLIVSVFRDSVLNRDYTTPDKQELTNDADELHSALWENEIERMADSLQLLRQMIRESRTDQASKNDTILITAYYNKNSRVPSNLEEIKRILSALSSDNIESIILSGFTDASGSAEYNYALSGSRIEFIIKVLSELKVEPRKILSQNFGELYAMEEDVDPVRRVEIRIITSIH